MRSKSDKTNIQTYQLDPQLYHLHKKGEESSSFGLDNSADLIEGGFGLYSSADMKGSIGPVKTEYFRIALYLRGHAKIGLGIETYYPERNSVVFGFPGQVFSLSDPSEDVQVYYMLFKEGFISDILLNYPFFSYLGVQSFQLDDAEAAETEALILKIDREIKHRKADTGRAIRLYLQLILLLAHRSYERQQLAKEDSDAGNNFLFRRFVRLVGHHFMTLRKVSDYANLLCVSPDYLNRVIKSHAEKTAGDLIDDMILMEAKAYLRHTGLSNAEVAYRLDFSDPSHFNKFFKKKTGITPLEFRSKS